MFLGSLRQECPTGYVYDAGIQDCVKTWSTDVTECADPNKVWNELTQQCEYSGSSGGGLSSSTMTMIMVGLGALLLLSFMGGRASKKSGSRLVSRTSTRSVFA